MSSSLCKWRLSICIKNLLSTAWKSIGNRFQIGLEDEFISKSLSKSIFEGFWVAFGTNFGSQNGCVELSGRGLGAFPSPNWVPKAVWIPLGTIMEAFQIKFLQKLDKNSIQYSVPDGTSHRHANEKSNITLFTFNFHLARTCFHHRWYPIFFQKYCVFT